MFQKRYAIVIFYILHDSTVYKNLHDFKILKTSLNPQKQRINLHHFSKLSR